MSDAILIFTFSPIQSFIAEARRAADLFVGSQILVQLARAAGQAIREQGGDLIYPVAEALDKAESDVPNKLVARVPWEKAQIIADKAQKALIHEWESLADSARATLMLNWQLATDARWETIWKRQTENLWEVYWAAAQMTDGDYAKAYREASKALDARKRSRTFAPVEEEGVKDSLSGCREALHTHNMDARAYWESVSVKVGTPRLRPEGRERLDAVGAIKRACRLANRPFASTSTVAAEDFLQQAAGYLDDYQAAARALLGSRLEPIRDDKAWPYDGDLLFVETLTADRLADSYGLKQPEPQRLKAACEALRQVYKQANCFPRPYYAILVLDGDGMGKRIDALLSESDPEAAHRRFSQQLSEFADEVRKSVAPGFLVYAGGDDVLALQPLLQALPLARTLATRFQEITGGTASAGLAIAHHLYPLDAALEAAREAEKAAKGVPGKSAVCVRVLKRSGETVQMRSKWDAMGDTFGRLVALFQSEALSNKLPYAVAESAYALPQADALFESELRRLLHRHRHPTRWQEDEAQWAATLHSWAATLSEQSAELARWLTFARFIAQGGE